MTTSGGTDEDGQCTVVVTANKNTALDEHVIAIALKGPATADNADTTATVTVVGKPVTAVFVDAPTTLPLNDDQPITIRLLDANGDAVANGVAVKVQATGDGLVIGEGKTAGDNGEVTRTVIATAADDQGLITLVVSVGDAVIGQRNFEVGAMVDAAPVTVDAFAPAIAAAGQTFTSYSGGTVAELMGALAAAGATSATAALADGSTVTVIVGAPGFVNADFNAAFSNGVPAPTVLAVRSLN